MKLRTIGEMEQDRDLIRAALLADAPLPEPEPWEAGAVAEAARALDERLRRLAGAQGDGDVPAFEADDDMPEGMETE